VRFCRGCFDSAIDSGSIGPVTGVCLRKRGLAELLALLQALLHRAATGRPLSLLKYAMTADGKIACSSGHSAWVSSPESRKLVFEARARSDAIIVGGNTVRACLCGCSWHFLGAW
jgi:hypothetical protein